MGKRMNTAVAQQARAEAAERAGAPTRLLLIAEDPTELAVLRAALASERVEVQAAEVGRLDRLFATAFDVALVRAEGPSPLWQEATALIQSRWGVPVVCLLPTPAPEQVPLLAGLRADAFAFLPLRIEEVSARIELCAWKAREESKRDYPFVERRRSQRLVAVPSVEVPLQPPAEQLLVDDREKKVRIGGRSIHLSPMLYKLLLLLASDPGRVFSVGEISAHLWPRNRTRHAEVQQSIYLLRRRIEKDPHNPEWVLAESGFGYKLRRSSQD